MFENLQKKIKLLKPVVVMHDFFIDRIVRLNNLDSLIDAVNSKVKLGGGSIRGIEQEEVKGGNAVNTAYALAKLGARTLLITAADDLGSGILKNRFGPFKNARLMIKHGRQGYTVSFEVGQDGRKANVMINDVGDAGNFGAEKLGEQELNLIKNASAVIVANWASNLKGTELTFKAFQKAGKNTLCFLDPADISTRKEDFKKCLLELRGNLDVLSLNENECRLTMQSLSLEALPINYASKDIAEAAKKLASELSLNVDVHTPLGCSTSDGKESTYIKSFEIGVNTSTGAGDAWDAADALGYLCGLNENDRLLLANVCAALFVSNKDVEPPTLKESLDFISKFENY
ncbi:MAG: PfkB family carbohydrate kinase [Nitrososphaerales archaeon]